MFFFDLNHVFLLIPDNPDVQQVNPPVVVNTSALKRQGLFTELVSLHLSGKMWNPNLILPTLLISATRLTKLSLLNMAYRGSMDQAMSRVLSCNTLSSVAYINLYSGCSLSLVLLRKLIFDCPKLTGFSFIQPEGLDLSEIERLRLEVAKKNLDIKLCCLEMYDF